MKKNILIVTSSLAMGGLEKSLINFCNNIDYGKFNVDLYLFNDGRELLPQLNKNVNLLPDSPYYSIVYNLPFFKSLRTLIKQKKFRLTLYRIKRFIKARLHIDTFSQSDWKNMKKTMLTVNKHYNVAIGYEEETAGYFVAECINADVKSVWVHTDIMAINTNKKLDIKTFKKVDYICTVSNNSKDSIMAWYPEFKDKIRVFCLPSLYDYQDIMAMADENSGIIAGDYTIIVSVGRLVELKGFHLCVEACAKLVEQGYKIKWYVCGEGIYREKIENEIQRYKIGNHFILLGNCANPYKYIKASDICVQPSSYEGFPLSVYEEKLLKKAVVVSDIPSHREMITDKKNGIIVSRDANSIYNGVKNLLDDRTLLDNISIVPINNFVDKQVTIKEIEKTFCING